LLFGCSNRASFPHFISMQNATQMSASARYRSFFGPHRGDFPGEIAFFRIESSRHLSDTARLILVTGRGGIIMSSITLATAAINPQLVFKANVERAIAIAEEQSPADYNAILEILDRLAEGTFLGEDHDRLAAFVDRYARLLPRDRPPPAE
jgi:hypothetical protein